MGRRNIITPYRNIAEMTELTKDDIWSSSPPPLLPVALDWLSIGCMDGVVVAAVELFTGGAMDGMEAGPRSMASEATWVATGWSSERLIVTVIPEATVNGAE